MTFTHPYHAAATLDLKRGWTGCNNSHVISRTHCLCPFSLVSNLKWRLRGDGLLSAFLA